jgi:ATP synthase F1 gamma subunit
MNIKIIVKAMNFHALLHVEAARRKAKKYFFLEQEISRFIDMIVNNRNFILDKHTLQVDSSKPTLNIYIGSDYGFCGGINFHVNNLMLADDDSEKIVIGKKLYTTRPNILLSMTREAFDTDYSGVGEQLKRSIQERRHSAINVIYNHYNNSSSISLHQKQIFPINAEKQGTCQYDEDFVVEGKVEDLLISLVLSYLNYEVNIAVVNSFASENIMRQNATSESLKKIDEWQEEELRELRKLEKQKMLKKVLDSYMKKKGLGGNDL